MLTEESMRIVAVSMSPKPFGNTEYLLDRVADGIMETGGTVEKIRTQELEIAPCEGCNGCMRTGRCVIADQFVEVAEKLVHCDGIVFATPLYFMNVPARGKALIDRLQYFWNLKYRFGVDRPGSRIRYALLISCAGHAFGPGGSDVFRGLEDTMHYAFDALGLARWGSLFVRRTDSPDTIKQDESLSLRAYRLGEGFARAGFPYSPP